MALDGVRECFNRAGTAIANLNRALFLLKVNSIGYSIFVVLSRSHLKYLPEVKLNHSDRKIHSGIP